MVGQSNGRGGWVGRSIRRVEDPTLVTGQGRFTGDLPAALWVRFVRSSVAAGKIVRITAPEGARLVTAADVAGIKPIRPMLHKFKYIPVAQPILANGVVRFVGEPIAAVLAPSREQAEDLAERIEVEIEQTSPVVDARDGVAPGAAVVHVEAADNVIVEGRV
jgi:carbon-monoxide dehydrogenase large subunit